MKEAYQKRGKPIFIGENFSTIGAKFTEFVNQYRANTRNQTAMSSAFSAASAAASAFDAASMNAEEVLKPHTVAKGIELMAHKKTFPKTSYKPGVKNEIMKIVKEAYEADMSAQETADMLKAHNLKKSDGVSDFIAEDVYNFRNVMKKSGAIRVVAAGPTAIIGGRDYSKAPPPTHIIVGGAMTKAADIGESNSVNLFKRILGLNLPPEKTVQFKAWLLDGKINMEQALWFLDIIERR